MFAVLLIFLFGVFVFFCILLCCGIIKYQFQQRELNKIYLDNYNKKPTVSCDICNWSLSCYATPEAWIVLQEHMASTDHEKNLEQGDCNIKIQYSEEVK